MGAELDKPFASVTVNVTLPLLGIVGTPFIVPSGDRVRPAGRVPPRIDHL
jgi:hypothetical protein